MEYGASDWPTQRLEVQYPNSTKYCQYFLQEKKNVGQIQTDSDLPRQFVFMIWVSYRSFSSKLVFGLVCHSITNINCNFTPSDLTIPEKSVYLDASYHILNALLNIQII